MGRGNLVRLSISISQVRLYWVLGRPAWLGLKQGLIIGEKNYPFLISVHFKKIEGGSLLLLNWKLVGYHQYFISESIKCISLKNKKENANIKN